MAKLVVNVQYVDESDAGTRTDEWQAVFDIGDGHTRSQVQDIVSEVRTTTRRVFIRRGVLLPQPEDTKRKR